jgi:hypothetical protein
VRELKGVHGKICAQEKQAYLKEEDIKSSVAHGTNGLSAHQRLHRRVASNKRKTTGEHLWN